ncbi:Ltp family lipoprotein [Curtobacterium sp. MCJR17_020]|uniref:Ltp family lipoprotein n=1 Tax=Curtobacterium sp. MCJR17_020 TaxID=2175619 RepID=UPI000DA98D51|nr:Ltp family lipoprotein [Curtobacterium sp. MCJR17_020]WIE72904.1 Ltp family lipoprotein [Curtobacterium sp. MCJR17_020]
MSQTPPPYPQPSGAPQQTFAPFPGAPLTPKRASGLALAALLVGIGAFLVGLIPVFGAIVGAVAIVLAVLALRKQQPKGLAVTGLVFGIVAALSSIGVAAGIGAVVSGSESTQQSAVVAESPEPTAAAEAEEPSEAAKPSEAAAEPAEKESESTEATPEKPATPVEYASALTKAESYSEMMHMSKAGLYDQLTSEYGEQFSPEAAQYAIDTIKADWNANALAKAKDYQANMSMSPAAIRDQLVSEYGEKFTPAEADFAIAHLNG